VVGIRPALRSDGTFYVSDIGSPASPAPQHGGGVVHVAHGSKDVSLRGKCFGGVMEVAFKEGIDEANTCQVAIAPKASNDHTVASKASPQWGRSCRGVAGTEELAAASTGSVQLGPVSGPVSGAVVEAGGGVSLQVPEDLKWRIDALQYKNQDLWRFQDDLLHGLGSARGSCTNRNPQDNSAHYCGKSSNNRMRRAVSSSSLDLDPHADARRGVAPRNSFGASTGTGYRNRPSLQPTSMTQQLRRYHECLQVQDHRDDEHELVAVAIQRRLRQINELQEALAVLGEEQRRRKHVHKKQLRDVETVHVKKRCLHQLHALQLEEALLAQGLWREDELAGEFQQLGVERADAQATSARLQTVKAEEGRLASDASGRSSLPQSVGTRQHECLALPPSGTSLLASRSSPQLMQYPLATTAAPPAAATAAISSPAHGAVLALGGEESPPAPAPPSLLSRLPPGLPELYEAAITIILEHGWEALHGGENGNREWTALHWAACEGRVDICELLLSAGADAGHLDDLGRTALDYALHGGARTAAAATLLAAVTPPALPAAASWQGGCATSSPSVSSICASSPIGRGAPTPTHLPRSPLGHSRATWSTTNSMAGLRRPQDEQCV